MGNIVKKILLNLKLNHTITDQELVEKELFSNENYRKIKKKLIFEIASARIQELAEVFLLKNINLASFQQKDRTVFLNINNKQNFACFKEIYNSFFSKNDHFKLNFIENIGIEETIDGAFKLVNFGWKKEAIPVIHAKKSIIAKFFDMLFN